MELMIPLINSGDIPFYEQIYCYLKQEIRQGSLRPPMRLPSTRQLADHLKVSRSTTQMAYDQLLSEGYILAVPCKGYYVAEIDSLVDMNRHRMERDRENEADTGSLPDKDCNFFGDCQERGQAREVCRVDFSPRGIDLDSFPFNTWRKITKNTLVDDNKEMFVPGDPQGEKTFREAIRSYLHSARGVNCNSGQIIVGAGSEYLLMLLSGILGEKKTIAMENPTYKQAYRVFDSLGYHVVPVEMDQAGMNVGLLSDSGADIAYVMPSHQYPTGIVMPVRRRRELLGWAGEKQGRYLIEDDYDSEFRYKGKPIPALQGMDTGDRVIYIGTFSKSVAPAIRIGYLVLPLPLLKEYREKLSFYASTVSRIDQTILYRFMTDGFYERHLNRMRAVYKSKHDCILAGLKPLEARFSIKGEYAGLHLLLTDRRGESEESLVEAAKMAQVRVYGLSSCFIGGSCDTYPSTVLLGYANLKEDEIEEGLRLLEEAWS